MFSKLAVTSALAAIASAATIQIDVSNNNDVHAFSPNSVKAAVGDTIKFAFHSSNIAVRSGPFDSPCSPSTSGGFFSAYQIPPTTFSITVQNTDPIFFYSTLQGHCQEGFAGVINPTSSQTIAAYQAKAKSVTTTTGQSGNTPIGGTIGQGDNSYSSAQVYNPAGGSSSGSSSSSMSSMSGSSSSSSATRSGTSSGSASVSTSTSVSTTSVVSQSRSGAAATQLPAVVAALAGVAALL